MSIREIALHVGRWFADPYIELWHAARASILCGIGVQLHGFEPRHDTTLHQLRTDTTVVMADLYFTKQQASMEMTALAASHKADPRPEQMQSEARRMGAALGRIARKQR